MKMMQNGKFGVFGNVRADTVNIRQDMSVVYCMAESEREGKEHFCIFAVLLKDGGVLDAEYIDSITLDSTRAENIFRMFCDNGALPSNLLECAESVLE